MLTVFMLPSLLPGVGAAVGPEPLELCFSPPLSFTGPLPRPAPHLLKRVLTLTMSVHVHLTWSVSMLL